MSNPTGYRSTTSIANVLAWVGNVPLHRVRCDPPPGGSTLDDLNALNAAGAARYELVAGVVVERANSRIASCVRARLADLLRLDLPEEQTSVVVGSHLRLDRFLVRLPDIGLFASPDACVPICVAEVIHPDNTTSEMLLKLA